jgi:starvation-inducible DNA-binding protein
MKPVDNSNGMNAEIALGLRGYVAESYALLAKTQACHWNATGSNFFGLHKLTEMQYGEIFVSIDTVAERLRALNAEAPRGLDEIHELSTLEDTPAGLDTTEAVRLLVDDHATLAAAAKSLADTAEEAEDLATHDLLVTRIAAHQKAAWMLRSHLS